MTASDVSCLTVNWNATMARCAVTGCLLVLWAVFAVSAHAMPWPAFMFSHLEQASAVIVVARVREVREENAPPVMVQRVKCTPFTARCEILAVWNGTIDGGAKETAVHFLRNEPFRYFYFEELRKGELAVLFLKRNDAGELTLARELRSKIPLASYSGALDKPGADVKSRVAAQLIGQLEAKEPRDVESAIYWAGEIEYAIPEQRLISLFQHGDVGVQFAALSQLVRRGNRQAVGEAVKIVLSTEGIEKQQLQRIVMIVADGPDGTHVVEQEYLAMIHRIAWDLVRCVRMTPVRPASAANMIPGMMPGSMPPTIDRRDVSVSVEQANAMAGSKDATVSRCGIRILTVVGDSSSVPVLISGLESPDREARYGALRALDRILDRQGPSSDRFFADPDGEVARFRSWWAKELKSLAKEL